MPHPSSLSARQPASTFDWNARNVAILFGLTLLAAGLRGSHVGARDFWFDESCTYVHVHGLFHADSPPLPLSERPLAAYYALVWAWTRVFGESEVGYRSLSLAASVLAVPVLGLAARSVGGSTVGWICAVLAAFHPLSVYYAREARPYACWLLLLSVTFALLVRAAQRNRKRDWALFGGALLITLHFHAFTLWWAPCGVAAVALACDRRSALRRWMVTMVVTGAAFVPMLVLVVVPVARLGSNAWIGDAPGEPWPIARSLSAFLPAGEYPGHLRGLSLESPDTVPFLPEAVSSVICFVVIGTVILLAGMSLREGVSKKRGGGSGAPAEEPSPLPLSLGGRGGIEEPSPQSLEGRGGTQVVATAIGSGCASVRPACVHAALAVLTLGPLMLMQFYAWVGKPCYVVGRYDLIALPSFLVWISLAVGWCFQTWRRRVPDGSAEPEPSTAWRRFAWLGHPESWARGGNGLIAIVLLLAACSLDPLLRLDKTPPGPTFARARAERLTELAGAADLVLTLSYDRAYLAYYLDRGGFRARVRSFPASLDRHIGWVDTRADLEPGPMASLARDAEECVDAIKDVHRRGGTVWFLPDSLDPLDRGSREAIHRVLRGALRAADYRVLPVDEPLLIGRVEELVP